MIVLLDANNLAMRAFHAAKNSMTAENGRETGSLQIFATSLSKQFLELQPTSFVACWDGGGQTFRHRLYPDYKAARKASHEGEAPHQPAFRLIAEWLDLVGLAQWRQDGVEADDLIAAAWRRTRRERPLSPIAILSSDKDLLQLLDEKTTQIRWSSYGTPTDVWDRERVQLDLGYNPEQIPLVMALTGDQSDGVPGARGIGPVKAVKLLRQFDWNFDRAAEQLSDYDLIWTSRDLVDLLEKDHCEVSEVPDFKPLTRFSPDATKRLEAYTEFCARYQLRTLWERLVDGTLWC